RLTGRIAENERDGTCDPEDHEGKPVVLQVRIELGAQQQRHKPDQWQRSSEDSGDDHGRRPCSLLKRDRRGRGPRPPAPRPRCPLPPPPPSAPPPPLPPPRRPSRIWLHAALAAATFATLCFTGGFFWE